MRLFKEWKDLIESQTEASYADFWDDYSTTEKRIYNTLLTENKTVISGTFADLATKYEASLVLFMGFLDGVNSSLRVELPIEGLIESSEISFEIDYEKLYFNMHKAGADYLYELPQWATILTDAKRDEIFKEYKKSKTVIKGEQIGRNDPCPCGSGKKYKKCCGA